MSKKLLFLTDVFEYAGTAPDANYIQNQGVTLVEKPLPLKNELNNWGFILFSISFLAIAYILNKRTILLRAILNQLFRNDKRHSIFFETVNNEFYSKLVLGCLGILFLSITVYCKGIHYQTFSPESPFHLFLFIGVTMLFLTTFFLYKLLTYFVIGSIFFEKETVDQWNHNFSSLLCLSAIVLFFPTLILFYIEQAYTICYYFILIYLFFVFIFAFYKIYILFFHEKGRLLHYILYLCTQEIIPLLFIYKGVDYISLIVQKSSL